MALWQKILLVLLLVWLPAAAPADGDQSSPSLDRLGEMARAYSDARFARCAELGDMLDLDSLRNPDTAIFLRAQCHFYSGSFDDAHQAFDSVVRRYTNSPHRALAASRKADCSWALGKQRRAAGEYRRVASLPADKRVDAAVGLFRRSSYRATAGNEARAQELFKRLRLSHPAHPLAASPPAGVAEPCLSFSETLRLSRTLHNARRWEDALAILDSLPEPRTASERYDLAFRNGRIMFDMRDRYAEALEMLLAARDYAPGAKKAEHAWFYASRALGRLDRDTEAVASHLAMVEKYPKGRFADRALFYGGWLRQNKGKCDLAIPLFMRVLDEYPDGEWADDARWFLAWCQIEKKDCPRAIDTLAPQTRGASDEKAGRALYWTAFCQRELGQARKAKSTFKSLARRFPLTWYSMLARKRLGPHAPPLRRLRDTPRPGPVSDPLLEKAGELIAAGLGSFASLLLRSGEEAFLERHAGHRGLVSLLYAYRKAGDFHRAWLLTLRKRYGSLKRLPTRHSWVFWDHAYPPCQRELLRQLAGDNRQLVLLLQAIMRNESGFDPQALSVANARGLMQMIPPTTREVAERLDIEYQEGMLFNPGFNLRTATWYIGKLVDKFRSQWPLAASAYNAGAPAMMEWIRENGHRPLDRFVEAIPWTESRRYAKRVIESFARYAYLEGHPLPRLSLRIDREYLEDDGIEY